MVMNLVALSTNINFPNLGIELKNVPDAIDFFGYPITLYGIIIAVGMLLGFFITEWMAKRTGQNKEIYLDFALYAVIISVAGARIYYVIFEWESFRDNPLSILNLRTGGLAIYGGILAAVATAIVFSRVKRYSFWLLADTACIGLITGQIIGRWGNFFNREAFGKYTNSLFVMQLDLRDVDAVFRKHVSLSRLEQIYEGREAALQRILEIRNNLVVRDGIEYIQVHPTFLYESAWNFCLLLFLIYFTRKKSFDGEVALLYFAGYGLGRLWIEGLRTDQLFLWGTDIAVSQLLAGVMLLASTVAIIYMRRRQAAKG